MPADRVKDRVLINPVSRRLRETPCARATPVAPLEVFSAGTEGNLPRPAPRQRPGPAYGLVLLGDPFPAKAGRSDPATNCGMSPSTRIPLPSHAAAAACPEDTGPASRSARQPLALPRYGARHRIAPLSRTKPRATACCVLHARLIVRPARFTARRSAMAVEDTPPFARDRDVALGALAARRPHCRAKCGEAHWAPSGAVSRQTLRPATPP